MYNFDYVFDRRNTEVIKWDRIEKDFGSKDLLPFGIADMDFEALPALREALVKRAKHPAYGYTYPSDGYYENFIKWNQDRNHFNIKREEIITVPGIVCACSFIIYALTRPGDKVMVNTPVYDPFFKVIEQQERELSVSSLIKKDGTYTFNLNDMEEKMKNGVKLLILCNPHNPVGRVWTRKELEQVAALCRKYQVVIFSDEIHSDLIYPGHKHYPILDISKEAESLSILAMAPSKTFNIAGLKSSLLVARNKELYDKVNKAVQTFHIGVDLFGLKATEAAYGQGAVWADELVEYLYENAKTVAAYLEQNLPKVKTYVPEGTYLMWLDFSQYGYTQEQLMDKLIKEAGVAANDGSHYGAEGIGFVRINIGTQRSMIMEALNRIRAVFP